MQQTESIPATGIAVFVSNRDRANIGESPYDFFVPPLDLSSTNTQSYTLLLKQVILKNNLHNVILMESDILEIMVNNILYINVFESGYYSAINLANSIQSFFNSIPGGIQITYDINECKMILTIPLSTTFKFVDQSVPSTYPYQYKTRQARFLELIGFQDKSQTQQEYIGATLVVAKNPVNLYGTSFVDINFQNSSINSINSTGGFKTIVRVPITTIYGQLEVFEPGVPITAVIESSILDNLRILITDEYGDILQGPEDSLVSLSFLLIANDF